MSMIIIHCLALILTQMIKTRTVYPDTIVSFD